MRLDFSRVRSKFDIITNNKHADLNDLSALEDGGH